MIGNATRRVNGSTIKSLTVTGTTAGDNVWVPANGLHIDIRSLHFTFQTGSTTSDAVSVLEYYVSGAWETLMRLGDKKEKFVSGHHMFVGHVDTDAGDGSNPRIRLVVTGSDADMVSSVLVEGREE